MKARLLNEHGGLRTFALVLATVHDASGTVLLAMSVAMPGDLHELLDVYPVT